MSPAAKEIWDAAQSVAFNHATREYFARCEGFGAVIPEGADGEPDFLRGEVSPLSEWACQDF